MRIGLVTSSYPATLSDTVSAGVFVRDLACELVKLGGDVTVIAPFRGHQEKYAGLNVCYIPWLGRDKDLASLGVWNPQTLPKLGSLIVSGLWNVSRIAEREKLHVLLAMWAIPSGLFCWFAKRQQGIPYGVWALGSDIWARDKYPFGNRIVSRVLRDASFRFADGPQLALDVTRIADAPCEFVPSVRELNNGSSGDDPQLPQEGTRFLFIGRYERNKGPDILVEAMRLFLEDGGQGHLYLFGTGSLEEQLRQRAKDYHSRIHVGGYAAPETARAFMKTCDWLVIPSRIESIPLVFVDALQMSIPVIATDVGDLGDMVRRFGVGLVTRPDPRSLADAMRNSISLARAGYAPGCKHALGLFSLTESARKTFQRLSETRAATPGNQVNG